MSQEIRFDNGAAYERFMGQWSQRVGGAFLDWLAVPAQQRWLDVGCGNGAFTELIVARAAPSALDGIDPSEAVLDYARARPALHAARLLKGDAMALPFAAASFDIAVMPLVIFFVPDPAKGVTEMARVTTPGGIVAAYGWDLEHGFPYRHVHDELREMGFASPEPPSKDASRPEVMLSLWQAAGLVEIESRTFTVERSFVDFEDYWSTVLGGPSTSAALRELQASDVETLQTRLRQSLPVESSGRICLSAWANAIRGRVSRHFA